MHKIIRARSPWRWIILFLAAWVSFMILATGILPFGRGEKGEWTTITHDLYNFSLDYPTKWRMEIFDEQGRRGRKEIKLNLYNNRISPFFIQVWLNPAKTPTLDEVITWYDKWIERGRKNVVSRGGIDYKELNAITDYIQEKKVFRKTYSLGDNIYDIIYLPRSNDMIVIKMQVPKESYGMYVDDFNRIVASFTSIE